MAHRWILSLLLLLVLWAGGGILPAAADTSFTAGFEKGLDAESCVGAPQASSSGAVARVPDRFGMSLVLGPGAGACSYALQGNMSLERGALIAWIRPGGWKTDAKAPVPILSARQGAASMALWWRAEGMSLIFSRRSGGEWLAVAKPAYDWTQPTWRHVILTWEPGKVALFVDGQSAQPIPAVKGADQPPDVADGRFVLGGDLGPGATLAIRRVTICTEPISADGARERFSAAAGGRVEHERPLLTVGPCPKPPMIDGRLAAGEWDAAAGTAGLVEIKEGVLSAVATRFCLSYDEKNLYMAFTCPFSGALTAGKYDRDGGAPWDEDSVEAWLQPEVGFTGKFFHLILNAQGSLWDAEDQNAAWNGAAQWAVSQGEGEWTAEIAVPHASLGTMMPSPGTKWQANFCRNVGASRTTNRYTEWAFTGGSGYGVWQMFGALVFRPQSPLVRVETLTATPGAGAEVRMFLCNGGTQAAKLSASMLLHCAQGADEPTEVAAGPWTLTPGERKAESIRSVGGAAVDHVGLRVRDAGSDAVLLSQMVRAGSAAPVAAAPVAGSSTGAVAAAPPLTNEMLGAVIRERAEWENNRLGITDKVPPPWPPMAVGGKTVRCWGRAYDYEGSLLPRQVASAGAEVLARPIALVARIAGEEIQFQRADQQAVIPAPHQVDVDSQATGAGLTIRVRSHLEYDGCVKVELSLAAAGKPVLLDGLDLCIPLKPERALYYHWFEATRDPRLTNAGALPQDGLKGHFKPLLWLGDDDRGFCWFGESPKGWENNDKESVLLVERRGDACVMRIRMADRPFVISTSWRTVFGLMATPVRPMPEGWRDWLIPLNQTNPWSSWAPTFNNLSGTDDPGTLMPRDAEAMRRWVRQTQEAGLPVPFYPDRERSKVIPYSQIVFWSGKHRDGMPSPEIKLFGPEWSNRRQPPGPRREADDRIPLKEYYWVCPQSSFAQFYIYKLNRLIDETGIDGIYIDGPWNICSNPLHGCGYEDDQGRWQAEYKIWPYRELLKRMYCLFHEKRKAPVLHFHTSCWLAIPCLSFCHMMLDGEQYHDAGQKVEDHFMDIVPLDKWRAEHTGRQWGPAPFLLPDIPPQWTKPEAPTRELLMLTNLHDTALFPAGNNLRLVMRNYQARRIFGVAECEFRGYWGDSDWVTCDTPEIRVSVYRKPDGSRCLLVVGNSAKADAVASVRPVLAGLKLQGAAPEAGVDLETGEKLPIRNGVLTLPVKARDFRLVAMPYYTPPAITAGDYLATALTTLSEPGFENGMARWTPAALEGNAGSVEPDTETKFSGTASCHLHKADGPGGVMITSNDVFRVEAGRKYRVSCRLKIANSTGARAYWMIGALDSEGNSVVTNNLFSGFVHENQDWKPQPFEFQAPPGAAVVRLHFLVAFPGAADVWVDDLTFEEVKP